MSVTEGRITVEDGFEIWYRSVGEGSGVPLLTLHGGPGAGHDYLEAMEDLAVGRRVIFYDQLGCGRSDQPDDPGRWTFERFCNEIDIVRAALGLDRVAILGQSWGGWLLVEYLLGKPDGVVGAVLASTSASMPQFRAECDRLKSELPDDVRATLAHYEALGEYDAEEYHHAVEEFYGRHVCRLDPEAWPDSIMRTVANLDGNQVYATMNGPNEFVVIGTIRDWERRDRLGEIDVPTLITCGRYDELTPACAQSLHDGIAGSELVIFEQSAHVAHIEEREHYMQVVNDFLGHLDAAVE